jgi:LmbE family N-acetylglucosaminyl deacetylase
VNVLVIAPHPDDESIGCGGTISRHTDRGDRVAVIYLSSGELGLKRLPRDEAWRIRESEAEAAAEILGIRALSFLRRPDWYLGDHVDETTSLVASIFGHETPGLVYVPHAGEWHPDHRAALQIVQAVLRGLDQAAPHLLAYEVWTPLAAHDHVEDISTVMERKLQAIRCYQSQLGHFRYDRAVEGLNQYRGALAARCDYAEIFQSVSPRATGSEDLKDESTAEGNPW